MRGFPVLFVAIAVLGWCGAAGGHSQKFAAPSSPPEVTAEEKGCEFYFALQPIDHAAVQQLATPIVPANRTVFTDAEIRELQNWDLPSKVTAWHERPSAEELARQWDELNKKWSAGAQKKDKSKNDVPGGYAAPYDARTLPAKEWQDLEKWFGKNAPKKVSGLCIDPAKATFVLAIGIVSGGASVVANNSNRVGDYTDYASKPLPESLGPNAAKVSPHTTPNDEFTGSGISDPLGGNTCVYLYRTNGKAMGAGGARQAVPEYYYCHAGGGISQSTVTTMLKYLSKTGLR